MEDRTAHGRGFSPRLVFAWLYVGSSACAYGVFLLSMLSLLVSEELDLDEATLGIALASVSLGGLASPFVAGMFADRTGPRPISVAGLGCVSIGTFLAAIAPASWTFILGVFLAGAGLSMFGVMSYAWINESLGDRKGVYLGIYVTSLVTGLSVSGLSVAFLLPYVPTWRTFYVGAAILALVPAGFLGFLLPRRLGVPPKPKDIRAALRDRDVRWVAGLQYLVGVGGGGFAWLPFFLVEARSFDLQIAVLTFVVASILWGVSGIALGRLADRGWSRPTIVLGGLGTGLAYFAFVLLEVPIATVGLLFVYSALWPSSGQVPVTFLGQRLGPRAQRTELGLLENLFLAGDATGSALVGWLAGPWGLVWAFALIPGGATLLAGVLFAWVYGWGRGAGAARSEEAA